MLPGSLVAADDVLKSLDYFVFHTVLIGLCRFRRCEAYPRSMERESVRSISPLTLPLIERVFQTQARNNWGPVSARSP